MTEIKREDVQSAMADAHESSFACAECAFLGPCRRCRTLAMVVALGEQWLARHVAWWTLCGRLRVMATGIVLGRTDANSTRAIGSYSADVFVPCSPAGKHTTTHDTQEQARAWVESHAIAAGYEIVREP
jgi:hypothetical protein